MAKKQEIVTKLSADSKELNSALDTEQEKLKDISKQAEKTAKSVEKVKKAAKTGAKADAGQAVEMAVGKGVESAAAQGLTQALGVSGPAATALTTSVKSMFASGAALAVPAIGASLALAAKKFGDRIQEALDIAQGAEESAAGDTTLYQKMQQASAKTGASVNDLSSAYKKFSETLESAKNGSADAIEALAKLGLQASDLSGDTGDAFVTAAAALGDMGRSSESAAAAMAVFGTESAKVQDALGYIGDHRDDLSGIIGEEAVDSATRVAEQWEAVKAVFDEMGGMVSSWTDDLVTGAQNWLADVLEGVAALAKSGGDSVSADEFQRDLNAARDRAEQRKQAMEVAKRAREEEARRKRNAEADKKTAQYQDQQQRDALRRRQQQKKTEEQYNLARMTPEQRAGYLRSQERDKYLAMGYSADQAEELTRVLYDPRHRGDAAKSMPEYQAERRRDAWKQEYRRRNRVSENVAEAAARKMYDPVTQAKPSVQASAARSFQPARQATAPATQADAILANILDAVQQLQKNTYVVE